MARKPMNAAETRLLENLRMAKPGAWTWRDQFTIEMHQSDYSQGVRGLLERGLIETRRAALTAPPGGRPRIEVRLKGGSK